MALIRHRNWYNVLSGMLSANIPIDKNGRRWYASNTKMDWNKLRPMIEQRVENRSRGYPIKAMVPVAEEVLLARSALTYGVSTLLKALPVVACKKKLKKNGNNSSTLACALKLWGSHWGHLVLGPLVPVETFRLDNKVHDVIKHHQRFDFDRVPAVVELCRLAGASLDDSDLLSLNCDSDSVLGGVDSLSADDLLTIGNRTLSAWEKLRQGVQKLLLVYTAKVCKYCSEVHVGPSGHKARLCGVFKYQHWRWGHFWEKGGLDDLVPPKIVWCRRPQDPPTLLDEFRSYYGHTPAVVDLCIKAGAAIPPKYYCLMKWQGLRGPAPDLVSA